MKALFSKAVDNLDITLAALGCVLAIPLTIYLYGVMRDPVYAPVGIIVLLTFLGYLLIRRRSAASVRAQAEATPRMYLLLNILFFCLFASSIAALHLRPEPYTRPLGYFVATAAMAAVLAIEIIFLPSRKSATPLALFKIILLSLSLGWSQLLIHPGLLAHDPWYHRWFTMSILEAGHIPAGHQYSPVPGMHLVTGATSLIAGLDYKLAAMFSVSLLQIVCAGLFIFLLGRFIHSARTGLLAALVLGVANWHIMYAFNTIPIVMAVIFIPIIVYLLFKVRKESPRASILLCALLMTAVMLTHLIAAIMLAAVLFFLWIGSVIHKRVRSQALAGARIFLVALVLFTAANLGYATFVSGDISRLQSYVRRLTAEYPDAVRPPEVVDPPPVKPVITTLAAAEITGDSAVLRGEVELGDVAKVDVLFRYRVDGEPEWVETTPQMMTEPGPFSEEITGLEREMTYEFKGVVQWEEEEAGGDARIFTTDPLEPVEPAVTTLPAAEVTGDSAVLRSEVELGEVGEVDVLFRYRVDGKPEWVETMPQMMTGPGPFREEITGLERETTYEFKAVVQWEEEEEGGEALTFTTEPVELPPLSTAVARYRHDVVPPGEHLLNHLGLYLFFAFACIGAFTLLSRDIRNKYGFALAIAGLAVLAANFVVVLPFLVWMAERWNYLLQVVLAVPLGLALLWLAGLRATRIGSACLMGILVFALSFLLVMSPVSNKDNTTFSPNTGFRVGFTRSELQAVGTISTFHSGKLGVDNYNVRAFRLALAPDNDILPIDEALYRRDYGDCQGMLVLIREEIVVNPFRPPGGVFRLDHDPREGLTEQRFSRVYDSGSMSAFIR